MVEIGASLKAAQPSILQTYMYWSIFNLFQVPTMNEILNCFRNEKPTVTGESK